MPNESTVTKINLLAPFIKARNNSGAPYFGTGVPFDVKVKQVSLGMQDGNSASSIIREALLIEPLRSA